MFFLQPLSVYDLYYTLGSFVVNVMIYTGHGAVVRRTKLAASYSNIST